MTYLLTLFLILCCTSVQFVQAQFPPEMVTPQEISDTDSSLPSMINARTGLVQVVGTYTYILAKKLSSTNTYLLKRAAINSSTVLETVL